MKIDKKELFKIVSKSLQVKLSKIKIDTKSEDLEEWDSLGQLAIISALDKKFKGKVNFSKISTSVKIKDIFNFLKKNSLIKENV